ncbi:MAG: Mur ligase domain-containing protein [Candidatus Nanosyncoccaceae bacterium]|jgi:UDP-N-acetylmuramate--alanine ligase
MKIYFAGLSGKALSPLANLALDAGHQVFGSDPLPTPETTELEQRGVIFSTDQSGNFLRKIHKKHQIDWMIHTSAIKVDHPEITTAQKLGIKISKRDQFIPQFITEHNFDLIAVAGTHGKTTTTTMLVWLFHQLDIPISYLVGSTLPFAPDGRYNPKSRYFVYECDEYDHNFLHYQPKYSLIPALDYDHVDTYPTRQDYQAAFRQFIEQSGQVWLWQSDIYDSINSLSNITVLKETNSHIDILGEHNRRNGTLALELAKIIFPKQTEAKLIEILNQTPLAGRRFEQIAPGLFSDYAHHPTEVQATLSMAREYADKHGFKQVVAIYEPLQNSRQHQIYKQYPTVFTGADKIYWVPTWQVREDPNLEILTPNFFAKLIPKKTQASEIDDTLLKNIQQELQAGNLVLFMAGGKGDEWMRKHANEFILP